MTNGCDIVRDHFLVWGFTDANSYGVNLLKSEKRTGSDDYKRIRFPWTDIKDIRIEGTRIGKLPGQLTTFDDGWIEIVNPYTSYHTTIAKY